MLARLRPSLSVNFCSRGVNGRVALDLEGAGHMELGQSLGGNIALQAGRQFLAYQQGSSEAAVAEEIQVLLDGQDVAAGDPVQRVHHLGAQVMGDHLLQLRLAEVGQLVLTRLGDEILEIAGLVVLLQVLVQEVVIRHHLQQVGLGLKDLAEGAVLLGDLGDEVDDGPRLLHPFGRRGTGAGMEVHRVTDDLAHLPAGVAVVTDVGHPVLGQRLAADPQDGVPDRFRHPAIDTMAQHIIKLAILRGLVGSQIGLPQFDVLQAQGLDLGHPLLHLHLGKVQAQDFHAGVTDRKRDQIATRGAAQLQNPGDARGSGIHAEQATDERQTLRMSLNEGSGNVRDIVIRNARLARLGRLNSLGHPKTPL